MRLSLLATAALALAAPVLAQQDSAPQPLAATETVPPARDVAFAGTIALEVDATDTGRGIFRVVETIPVARPGRVTLLYPQWLPGNHAPRGPIASIASLEITAGGRRLEWRRDPLDVYAFHVDVPAGVGEIRVAFQHLSPTDSAQGRVTMTPDLLNLQWEKMSLYPAGYFVRNIPVRASVTLPAGWTAATSLDVESRRGDRLEYRTVPYETLVDSPLFAGRHARRERLAEGVHLNLFADRAADLAASAEQLAAHRRLAEQTMRLFGARYFDEYEFLVALTSELGDIGLEHLRSSENAHPRDYFTAWNDGSAGRDLLGHEFTHSWNGKYRRPAGLWTPDYRTPMQSELLWVYEGQTQFWGYVLSARAGMMPAEDVRAELARTAAYYDTLPGRRWRPLLDTTYDPILQARRPQPWSSWQRGEDYYSEGMLIWLEVDAKLRELSGGRRSIDDFARAFFGVRPGDQGILTYDFDEVVATLNGIAPFDWAGHLRRRVEQTGPAPLAWIEQSGYRLVYRDTPTNYFTSREKARKILDLTFTLGLVVGEEGRITSVAWDSPLFNAGATAGASIMAVNGRAYTHEALREAITAARGARDPIRLMIKRGDRFQEIAIDYHDGLRYPALERVGRGPSSLDTLLAPLP
ncbi:MAG: M61 family metallopeptidase [Allosphingosinicella sp.]